MLTSENLHALNEKAEVVILAAVKVFNNLTTPSPPDKDSVAFLTALVEFEKAKQHVEADKEIILAGKFDFQPNEWDEYKLAGEVGEELSSIINDYLINNNPDLAWLKNAKVEIRITPTK
jgi:hypothetical protein